VASDQGPRTAEMASVFFCVCVSFAVLGFELKALCLLGRCYVT
jgi:hypothetical protein